LPGTLAAVLRRAAARQKGGVGISAIRKAAEFGRRGGSGNALMVVVRPPSPPARVV
jgi:hypothetical protein